MSPGVQVQVKRQAKGLYCMTVAVRDGCHAARERVSEMMRMAVLVVEDTAAASHEGALLSVPGTPQAPYPAS
jgi:hypothetical protein